MTSKLTQVSFIKKGVENDTGDKPTCAWIDSLCIDQESDDAKGFWIPRMREVYSSAVTTFLTLPGKQALAGLKEDLRDASCNVCPQSREQKLFDAHGCAVQRNLSPGFLDSQKKKYLDIMVGKWRERLWIFQEYVLSRDLVLVDDTATMKINDLRYLCWILDLRDGHSQELWKLHYWHLNHLFMKRAIQMDHLSAAMVLQTTEVMNTTVPQDVYFGLCGVLKIDISYAKTRPVNEVQLEVFRALIRKGDYTWIKLAVPKPKGFGTKATMLPTRGQYVPFTLNPQENASECQAALRDDGSLIFGQGWIYSTAIVALRLLELGEASANGYKTEVDIFISPEDALAQISEVVKFWIQLYLHDGEENGHGGFGNVCTGHGRRESQRGVESSEEQLTRCENTVIAALKICFPGQNSF